MPQRSSIQELPEPIKQEVDRIIREDQYTLDEIVQHIKQLGAKASRSAVGRYAKNMKDQMESYRQAMATSKQWLTALEEDPESDVGRLLSEVIKSLAFQTVMSMGEDGKEATPTDLMRLSKALQSLSSSDKISTERYLKLKMELERVQAQQKENNKQVEKIIKKEGMSAQTRAEIMKVLTGGHDNE